MQFKHSGKSRKFLILTVLLSVFFQAFAFSAQSDINTTQSAQDLFSNFADRLFQVRTIDRASGSKASIGSAFAVSASGVLATNYHVVSKYVIDPEKYRIEVLTSTDDILPISVVNIDVINDLALVKLDTFELPVLSLADTSPTKGEQIYSLGNPRDLGMTVVPGTFNGTTAHSYYDRILFSGSVNPGMSGGPVLNDKGEVVGVNVATSGNQLSFLVPLVKLQQLMRSEPVKNLNFKQLARTQLTNNQSQLMTELLSGNWKLSELGDATVPGEFTDFISCWGESDQARDVKFSQVFKRCRNSEYIYIAPDFYTGIFEMEFYWYSTTELTNWQFYRMLNDSFGSASAGNVSSEDHVTEFQCRDDFLKGKDKNTDALSVGQQSTNDKTTQISDNNSEVSKVVYCVREYKNYPGLYDALYLSASLNLKQKSLVSHYTLSGVSQANAESFLKRFMESVL
ncbi:MAG: trypsin-like peptidase domain-containing protein [Gammaproteobacteria bacterium]|nr:trypsin-like peptidase domain-containing protein [Gammaproteobacteria bacterium]